MHNVKELNIQEMQKISGGGGNWQVMPFTPNMSCKGGKLATGNCRVNWDSVVNGAVNNVVNAAVTAGRH